MVTDNLLDIRNLLQEGRVFRKEAPMLEFVKGKKTCMLNTCHFMSTKHYFAAKRVVFLFNDVCVVTKPAKKTLLKYKYEFELRVMNFFLYRLVG